MPGRVRALRGVIRRLPRGRYAALAYFAPSEGRFPARLAEDAGGARFDCDLSDQIAREVCFTGLYEPPMTRVLQGLLKPGGVAIDAGANWGYFTLVAAAAVGDRGRVIALEPDPRQHALLSGNIAMNGLAHVDARPDAAADAHRRVTLTGYREPEANRGVSSIAIDRQDDGPRFEVDAVTIDGITRDLPAVDAVKIDVEGAEDLVLAGMRAGLASHRYRAVLLELHPSLLAARGIAPESCLRTLEGHGYRGWTIDASPAAYRRALDPGTPPASLRAPLDAWRTSAWPHLLWLC